MSVGSHSCFLNVAASSSRRAFWSDIFNLATLGARCIRFLDCRNSRTSLKGMAQLKRVRGGGCERMMDDTYTSGYVQGIVRMDVKFFNLVGDTSRR